MTSKRSKLAADAAQLAAALDGVPAHGYTEDVVAMVALADLLAPAAHTGDPFKESGREKFLREALVATAGGVDLNATTDADGVEAVYTRTVVLEDGSVIRVADVEKVTDDAAELVAEKVADAQRQKSLRR